MRQLTEAIQSTDDTDARYRRQRRLITSLKNRLQRIEAQLGRDHCQELNPCRNGGTCVNTYNSYFCQCPDTWQGDTCELDVDECDRFRSVPDLGCQNGATCLNIPGSYTCTCAPGYYGVHCRDRSNTCSSGSSQELCGHGQCVDTPGGSQPYTCLCDEGWTNTGHSATCSQDIDECSLPNPPCSKDPLVTCVNTPGSFTCGHCPRGYSGNGYYCTDVDECAVNNGGCSLSPRVACTNTRGSRHCGTCPAGYSGDGVTCIYLGACHISNGGCSMVASCVEMAGIVRCFCPPGYSGTGVGPVGCMPGGPSPGQGGPVAPTPPPSGGGGVIISPCASRPCENGGTCIPAANNYMCTCPFGWTGSRCERRENFCDSSPCDNGGTCVSNNDGYSCECPSGFTGHNCQEEVRYNVKLLINLELCNG